MIQKREARFKKQKRKKCSFCMRSRNQTRRRKGGSNKGIEMMTRNRVV